MTNKIRSAVIQTILNAQYHVIGVRTDCVMSDLDQAFDRIYSQHDYATLEANDLLGKAMDEVRKIYDFDAAFD